ncbi:hypothetical protein [Enterococcus gilvus]|uniref:hypothetical protein n=1 Tax=Enterococcus gilvus TaxID=160453 RepID=UPI00290EA232|nr:hypothetical protein [Enterococcus gilvus]MDU5509397.1 hypothetical protein [Enterococcus gilvus]
MKAAVLIAVSKGPVPQPREGASGSYQMRGVHFRWVVQVLLMTFGELAPGIVENTGPFAADVSEAACSSDVSTTSVPSVAGLESIAKTLFTRDFLC